MACNLSRWNWLIQGTYNKLPPTLSEEVMHEFFRREKTPGEREATPEDAQLLYDIMVERGIKIKGTDPFPPPPPPLVTEAGAAEYEAIMNDLESLDLA